MTANRFHNMSPAEIADEIGRLDLIAKGAKEQQDELKNEFKRRELNVASGENFIVSASYSTSKRLDTKKLRADFGDALDDYYTTTETTTIRVKPVPINLEGIE